MTQRCRIGRNPGNDLVIQDRAADDFHAVISVEENNVVYIEDLSTRFGTYVNGERIKNARLSPGDEVQIGFSRIDWEGHSSIAPQVSDIEIRPSFSVPVRRPIISPINSSFHSRSEERVESHYTGEATKELAHVMLENEQFVERIERESRSQEPIQEKLPQQPLNQPETHANETNFLPAELKSEVQKIDQSVEPLPFIPQQDIHVDLSEIVTIPEVTEAPSEQVKHQLVPSQSKKPMSETVLILLVLGLTAALVFTGWFLGQLS
jgi:pSer/pThr/pTyr-binding forkhead associated (FHA) protein